MPSAAPIGTWISEQAASPAIYHALSATSTQDRVEEAWWLNTTFVPDRTTYFSLRATDIDPSWTALTPLSYDLLPKEAADDIGWMRQGRFRFAWNGRIGKGEPVHVGTGVYKTRDGSTGRFLVVLGKTETGDWRVRLLHKEPGAPGFSVLRVTAAGLYWGTCMLCSDFRRITADAGSYRVH